MQQERVSEKASKAAKEATTTLEAIDEFESRLKEGLRIALRQSAAKERDKAVQKLMHEVEKAERDIREFSLLYRGNVVWVYAAPTSMGHSYVLSATRMKTETAKAVADKMSQEGTIYLPLDKFDNVVHDLRAEILEGRQDQDIHLTAEQLIYDRMKKPSTQ